MDTTLTKADDAAGRTLLIACGALSREEPLPEEGVFHIGRGAECEIRIDHPTLSRKHLRLVLTPTTVAIEDCGSRNGTRLAGCALDPGQAVFVAPGAPFEAGDAVLSVRGGTSKMPANDVERYLAANVDVVIVGPAGSGKSFLAEQFRRAAPERTLVVDEPLEWPPAPRGHRVVVTSSRELDSVPLAAVRIEVPPLHSRLHELPRITDALVARISAEHGRAVPLVSADALSAIAAHAWPGHIAELERVLTRAVLAAGRILTRTHLGLDAKARAPGGGEGKLADAVSEAEHRRILEALRQADGNQTRAAKLLGISRGTLISRLERYGVSRPRI
jgi:hypothetical protein